jgi:hypothetical protein
VKKLLILPLWSLALLDTPAFANCGHGACDSPAPEIGTGLVGIAAIVVGLIVAAAARYFQSVKRAV